MMKIRDRIAPIMLGLGLWVVGNGLIGVSTARGQEVAAINIVCIQHFKQIPVTFCPNIPVNHQCIGSHKHIDYFDMECNGPSAPDTKKCNPSLSNTQIGFMHFGYCWTIWSIGTGQYVCDGGPDSLPVVESLMENVPWCDNSDSQIAQAQKQKHHPAG